jgi:UTP--glucose-1-phosphate uridylyltransferase
MPNRKNHHDAFRKKMQDSGLHPNVIDGFLYYYQQILNDETGLICENDIEPLALDDIENAESLCGFDGFGKAQLNRCVMILLNGGLGTGMGLTGPKSLLPVKHGRSFLDLKLSGAHRIGVETVLMNSFSTDRDTRRFLAQRKVDPLPEIFIQNRFPKVLQDTLMPAIWPDNPELEWNPPGHGEIYMCLFTTGILDRLLSRDKRYAFICNSDNLGAGIDESILGYFVQNALPFLMEVAVRTPSDMKGGHLARHKDGRLLLREIAQCPATELDAFQDIEKFHFFNTNSLWVDLARLKEAVDAQGVFRLPMILKPGYIDPRDETSPRVFQVEMAMGAAIANFKGAAAICVPKSRFIPVKTCNDLLTVRSDCYQITETERIVTGSRRLDQFPDPPKIRLDPKYYKRIDDFDQRFRHGPPSLARCESLTISGDVVFENDITILGNVTITNRGNTPATIPQGSVIEGDMVLG